MPRVRASVRLWQTELFIIVIVVAILVLSSSLTRGLDSTLRHLGEASQLNNAASLASALSPEFPLTVESLQRVKTKVADHSRIYADAVWVYDLDGTLYAHSGGLSISDEALDQARRLGLADSPPFTSMNLKSGGYSIAGKAIYDSTGRRAGSVVVAGSVSTALAVLDAVRSRLWTTFWIALIVAGLLGFVFSEFIGRRVREMSRAATAIAAGDFNQRVPLGMVPDEVRDLAESYNLMAVKLGEAFSEVEQREQEIRAVVTSMAEGVIAFDSAGTVRVINPEAIRLLEDPPVDLVGVPARAITGDPNVLDAVAAGLSGAPVSSTATIGERTVLLHCTPLRSREGEAQGAVLVLGDVTERTRLDCHYNSSWHLLIAAHRGERIDGESAIEGDHLGPILVQLPPNFKFDAPLLEQFLSLRPPAFSFAFEVRHASWYTEETYEVLRRYQTALCLSETEKLEPPTLVTAPFAYARLRLEEYTTELDSWLTRALRPATVPTWFLMSAGKRWAVMPHQRGQDEAEVDRLLTQWLEKHVFA